MFKFDKKTANTIKIANKYKSRIEKAEKLMSEMNFPETFENGGKIKENIKLLNSTKSGIKSANTILEEKIAELNAIGKKNNLKSNISETKGMQLLSDSNIEPAVGNEIEYEDIVDFVNFFIDWNKYKESRKGSSLETIILEYIFKLWQEHLNNNISEEELKEKISQELYNNYGIRINSTDIDKIDITDTNNIHIILNDGTNISLYGSHSAQYVDGYRVRVYRDGQQFYIMSDGGIKLDDDVQKQIKEGTFIKDDTQIKGFETITVNGHKINIFWVGDDVEYYVFQERVKDVEEQLSKYFPPEVLECILESGNFKGFYVGTNNDVNSGQAFWKYQAVAISDEYVYINSGLLGSLNAETTHTYLIHELGHIFDVKIGADYLESKGVIVEKIRYSSCAEELGDLYKKYKKKLQKYTWKGYNRILFPNGIPSATEFFAELFTVYCIRPDELKESFPELYEYINKLIKNT